MATRSSFVFAVLPLAGCWLAGAPLHATSQDAARRAASPRAMFSGIVEEMGKVASLEKRTDIALPTNLQAGAAGAIETESKNVIGLRH